MERSVRQRLVASPACPAPMTTAGTCSMIWLPSASCPEARLDYFDSDVYRIGDDVVYGRTLLRLRDNRFDLLLGGIRVNRERHLDIVVAVPHLAVDAKDAADIHLAFQL